MNPKPHLAGLAGILAGLGLLVEGALFMTSGWTPETFGTPAAALAFLQDSGAHLRAAVFAGAINLIFTALFVAGLAARLHARTPTRATATLYLGLIGIAGHGLVPLGLWLGVPKLVTLAVSDPALASSAWAGFNLVLSGAGGLGNLFLGLSLLAAGWAIVSKKALPATVGWLGLIAGGAVAISMLVADTPLSIIAGIVYFPSLLLVIAFRTWAGIALWRSAEQAPNFPVTVAPQVSSS